MTFEVDPRRAGPLPFVVAWAGVIVLGAVSLWTAFLGMGVWAPIVQFGIAFIQAGVVYVIFMRLKGPPSVKWIFAVSGFFWLLFLYGISMTDYSNRRGWPPSSFPAPPALQTPARDPSGGPDKSS
jgi:cytochrome c oxidase subunit 4